MSALLTTLAFLLPPCRAKNRLLTWLGHVVHPSARVGICMVRNVDRFELAQDVLVGHFNWFRNLASVEMGRGAQIVKFNWIFGGSGFEPSPSKTDTKRTLRMGPNSHILSQHYLDCGGGLLLEEDSWITGIRTTVLTHAFDPHEGGLILEPVVLRRGSVLATCCTVLPGVTIAEGALVAAGSAIWTRQEIAGDHISGGVPARRLAPIKISR